MSDGIIGSVPCELIGGPLDGTRYGDLPDVGDSWEGVTLSIPTGQPERLIYRCDDARPVPVPELGIDLLHFHWVGVEEPEASVPEPVEGSSPLIASTKREVTR